MIEENAMIHRTLLEIDNPSRHPSTYLIVEALLTLGQFRAG
jgi:hypothetical protein